VFEYVLWIVLIYAILRYSRFITRFFRRMANSREPLQTVGARVVGKRLIKQFRSNTDTWLADTGRTALGFGEPCRLAFLTDQDRYYEMPVDFNTYSMFKEGDYGILTHKGNLFYRFDHSN